jgi:type IV secretory pathway ATPase VirB11/archaellum biosynthesis ATPase
MKPTLHVLDVTQDNFTLSPEYIEKMMKSGMHFVAIGSTSAGKTTLRSEINRISTRNAAIETIDTEDRK